MLFDRLKDFLPQTGSGSSTTTSKMLSVRCKYYHPNYSKMHLLQHAHQRPEPSALMCVLRQFATLYFPRSFNIWARCTMIVLLVSTSVYMAGLLMFGKASWHYHIETFIIKGDSTGGYFIGRLLFSLLDMRTGCDLHPASSAPCIGFVQPYIMYPVLWACIYFPCIYLVSIALVTLAPIRWIFSTYDRQLFAVERSA